VLLFLFRSISNSSLWLPYLLSPPTCMVLLLGSFGCLGQSSRPSPPPRSFSPPLCDTLFFSIRPTASARAPPRSETLRTAPAFETLNPALTNTPLPTSRSVARWLRRGVAPMVSDFDWALYLKHFFFLLVLVDRESSPPRHDVVFSFWCVPQRSSCWEYALFHLSFTLRPSEYFAIDQSPSFFLSRGRTPGPVKVRPPSPQSPLPYRREGDSRGAREVWDPPSPSPPARTFFSCHFFQVLILFLLADVCSRPPPLCLFLRTFSLFPRDLFPPPQKVFFLPNFFRFSVTSPFSSYKHRWFCDFFPW